MTRQYVRKRRPLVVMTALEIRADERARIIKQIRKAAAGAIPQATKDYLLGVEEGVRLIVEAVAE